MFLKAVINSWLFTLIGFFILLVVELLNIVVNDIVDMIYSLNTKHNIHMPMDVVIWQNAFTWLRPTISMQQAHEFFFQFAKLAFEFVEY
jgi:diacylglycerol kinase